MEEIDIKAVIAFLFPYTIKIVFYNELTDVEVVPNQSNTSNHRQENGLAS